MNSKIINKSGLKALVFMIVLCSNFACESRNSSEKKITNGEHISKSEFSDIQRKRVVPSPYLRDKIKEFEQAGCSSVEEAIKYIPLNPPNVLGNISWRKLVALIGKCGRLDLFKSGLNSDTIDQRRKSVWALEAINTDMAISLLSQSGRNTLLTRLVAERGKVAAAAYIEFHKLPKEQRIAKLKLLLDECRARDEAFAREGHGDLETWPGEKNEYPIDLTLSELTLLKKDGLDMLIKATDDYFSIDAQVRFGKVVERLGHRAKSVIPKLKELLYGNGFVNDSTMKALVKVVGIKNLRNIAREKEAWWSYCRVLQEIGTPEAIKAVTSSGKESIVPRVMSENDVIVQSAIDDAMQLNREEKEKVITWIENLIHEYSPPDSKKESERVNKASHALSLIRSAK